MMPNYEVLDDICCAADDMDCALISTLASGVLYHYDLMSGDLSEEEMRVLPGTGVVYWS